MADEKEPIQSVQTFGRKKTATAVAYAKRGKGLIKVNGRPLEQVEPKSLQFKLLEPVLLLGQDRYCLNIRPVYLVNMVTIHTYLGLLTLISASALREVVTCLRSTPSDRLSPSPWSPTTRSTLMSRASRR